MSNKINDGGPAFPVLFHEGDSGFDPGMTLRDYFAAKAMSGLLTAEHDAPMRGHEGWRDEFVREAYRFADAMLKVREE